MVAVALITLGLIVVICSTSIVYELEQQVACALRAVMWGSLTSPDTGSVVGTVDKKYCYNLQVVSYNTLLLVLVKCYKYI
jgi:threonine/homoserine efflux transporter RhtA